MSTEIIIILIGAGVIMITIIDGAMALGMISIRLRIPLGVIGILFVIYGGYSYGAINLLGNIEQVDVGNKIEVEYPVQSVQIISPVEGDSVKCRILTMGVYPDSHEKDIWVVLRPSDDRYYPQSDHTNTSYKRNGEWQVITRFGGDQGEEYEIIVYETDSSASAFFSSTIEAWKDELSFPGLELAQIPEGAIEINRFVVSLKENCRGVF